MLKNLRNKASAGAAILSAMALSALGQGASAMALPGLSKGQQGNKYNKFIGVSAEILQHNRRVDAEKEEKRGDFGVLSKGKRRKIAAKSRKLQNMQRNGHVPSNASFLG